MVFKTIPKKDLIETYNLIRNYVDENIKFEEIKTLYKKFRKLFIGCYIKKELIGICIPGIHKNEIYIKAIAVKHQYWGKGIGSKLLKKFERRLKPIQKYSIVPSADIEWVERFYLKNKYKPVSFLIKIKKENFKKEIIEKNSILDMIEEKNYIKIYVKVEKYDPKERRRIKKKFKAEEVIYIMKKDL